MKDQEAWEEDRIKVKRIDIKEDLLRSRKQEKRTKEDQGSKRRAKKLKYDRMEDDWGEGRRSEGNQEPQGMSGTSQEAAEKDKNQNQDVDSVEVL